MLALSLSSLRPLFIFCGELLLGFAVDTSCRLLLCCWSCGLPFCYEWRLLAAASSISVADFVCGCGFLRGLIVGVQPSPFLFAVWKVQLSLLCERCGLPCCLLCERCRCRFPCICWLRECVSECEQCDFHWVQTFEVTAQSYDQILRVCEYPSSLSAVWRVDPVCSPLAGVFCGVPFAKTT